MWRGGEELFVFKNEEKKMKSWKIKEGKELSSPYKIWVLVVI